MTRVVSSSSPRSVPGFLTAIRLCELLAHLHRSWMVRHLMGSAKTDAKMDVRLRIASLRLQAEF